MKSIIHRKVGAVQTTWLFEPRDLWLGIYWDSRPQAGGLDIDIYLCLLPCLPLRFSWWLGPDLVLAGCARLTPGAVRADPGKAYRSAVRRIGTPDQGGDEGAFRRASEAYEALK